MSLIVVWKKNGMRLRVLGEIKGRFGEQRIQVQKETAKGIHGLFSLKPSEVTGLDEICKAMPIGPAGDAGQVGWMGGEFDR